MVTRLVDLRSDTVTKPNEAMRAAMANAKVDDAVLGDDPTAFRLEFQMAQIMGKEAALFVPLGTMGNLISVLTHCDIRGSEVILGDISHIHIYENGGISTVGGVHARTVKNNKDGTMDINLIEAAIRDPAGTLVYPTTRRMVCKVYGLCGNMAVCNKSLLKPCVCLPGFSPVDDYEWEADGYSDGCSRGTDDSCGETDEFKEVGVFGFEGVVMESLVGSSKSICERSCLSNCSCIGLVHDKKSNICKTIYGSLFNLRNLSLDSTFRDVLYVRVPKEENVGKDKSRSVIWFVIGSILGCVGFLVLVVGMVLLLFCKRRSKGNEEDGAFPVLNLRAFSYKELYATTRGLSDKLRHGGFGAVFQGVLLDSTLVAVKRLERPGGAEKEFRAEVCTIGNIQHVNLVRLGGFCSENCHRLLVYDYTPNGPLSMYLRRDGPNLSWVVRSRTAIGTARGIAYLHEGCRDCVIHCDIKPENILLDTDYVAKVSDFGLAKLICRDFSRALVTMRGTWGYVAPEWISGVAITSKADVYSYGMTLLELLGGRRNVGAPPSGSGGGVNHQRDGENEDKWFFPPYAAQEILQGNIAAVVDSKLGNAYKIEEAERIALVAIWCIQDTEDVRPTMATVVKMLEGIVETPIPPAPKLLQALISGESYRGIQMQSENGNTVSIAGDNDRVSICGSQSSPGIEFSPPNENVNHRMV